MWSQIAAIVWAQWRTVRNHLPRTGFGSVLTGLLSLLWYGIFIGFAIFLIAFLPGQPNAALGQWLPTGLFGMFAYWQIIPLFTLSTGWSLQLNKLQMYPIDRGALFGIEVLLRLTSAPEMVIVLLGASLGLMRNPGVPFVAPLALFLFVPLNLFLSLAVRDLFLHSFERNRLRELFAVILLSIAILPQILFRTPLGKHALPYLRTATASPFSPWHAASRLSLGTPSVADFPVLLLWTALCYLLARVQFRRSLVQDDAFAPAASAGLEISGFRSRLGLAHLWSAWPDRVFPDPFAALIQKELESLVRMPRFRVIFGMACVFSVIVFVPLTMHGGRGPGEAFIAENFLPVVTLYGLLLLSEVLLLDIFGFDRGAAQLYFVTPVSLRTVVRAKNLIAIFFVVLQNATVLFIAACIRVPFTFFKLAGAISASAVVAIFFLSVGNLSSVFIPRPINAAQTFRKQAGGKMQLWLIGCSLGMFLIIGFAFLGRWALRSEWAFLGILAFEFAVGVVVYYVATESAVERALKERERIVDALSKGSSPVGLGS